MSTRPKKPPSTFETDQHLLGETGQIAPHLRLAAVCVNLTCLIGGKSMKPFATAAVAILAIGGNRTFGAIVSRLERVS